MENPKQLNVDEEGELIPEITAEQLPEEDLVKNEFDRVVDEFRKENRKDLEPDSKGYYYGETKSAMFINSGLRRGDSFFGIREMARILKEEGENRILPEAEGSLLVRGIKRPDTEALGDGEIFRERKKEFDEELRKEVEAMKKESGWNFDIFTKVVEHIDSLNLPEDVLNYSPAEEYKKRVEQIVVPIVERLKEKLKDKEGNERFPDKVKDGEFFEAHGIAKGKVSEQLFSLINLLKNGPDPNRPSLETTTYDAESDPHAAGGANKNGEFVLLGPKRRRMSVADKLNVETVFVNDSCINIIPDLQEMFPNVKFVARDDVQDFFDQYD